MSHPLYVAFVWHMHQPYYRDTIGGDYGLPWVRLHATKDYLHMVRVVRDFPAVHVTFNLVPCLVEQLEDYAHNQATDRCLRLSLKRNLTLEDRKFILDFFFSIGWDKVISRYPRYWQLLQLRQQAQGDAGLFSDAYYRDLIAWFNLAWIDPGILAADPTLSNLVDKGRDFTRDDIALIIEKHRELCRAVVPAYREAETAGQIEISTSPYYHPILPLLIDSGSARMASPYLSLPETRFAYPEDAAEQLRRAIDLHQRYFDRAPRGLWPSEGAISQELVELLRQRQWFDWLASDEGVLGRSTGSWFDRDGYGHLTNPRPLCQPYRLGEEGPSIIFRDHVLSDRIGFVYKSMGAQQAAEDLMHRLHRIRENLGDQDFPYLVPIILDGENCWESYDNNGDDFLRHLYKLLSEDRAIKTVTVSEYLDQFPPQARLANIVAGSWISSNLETWIGEREQNRAWDYLARTRARLVAWELQYPLADFDTLERAWQEIYIAEGSDWFWWYYSHNKYGNEQMFDRDYRSHLGNVYRIMGLPVPSWLKRPILEPAPAPTSSISGYMTPSLTASDAASPEWSPGGYVEPEVAGAAMQRSSSVLRRLYFGYNPADLHLRLEANESLVNYFSAFYLASPSWERANERTRYGGTNPLVEHRSFAASFEIAIEPGAPAPTLSRASGQNTWDVVRTLHSSAIGPKAVELSVSLGDLGLELGNAIELFAVVAKDGVEVESLPTTGQVSFTL
ncbi:MAG: hypothetical protein ACUVX1_05170, partial [Chloroflexota bacterium]